METATNKPSVDEDSEDDGYQVIWASAFEVGLLYNGKGVRAWWASEFDGQLPPLSHPLIREAMAIHDDEPTRIPCCFCGKPTTWDTTYGDLCYRCIRADNE